MRRACRVTVGFWWRRRHEKIHLRKSIFRLDCLTCSHSFCAEPCPRSARRRRAWRRRWLSRRRGRRLPRRWGWRRISWRQLQRWWTLRIRWWRAVVRRIVWRRVSWGWSLSRRGIRIARLWRVGVSRRRVRVTRLWIWRQIIFRRERPRFRQRRPLRWRKPHFGRPQRHRGRPMAFVRQRWPCNERLGFRLTQFRDCRWTVALLRKVRQ